MKIRIHTHALFTAFVCPIALLEKQGHELALFCDKTPPYPNGDHDYTYEILERRGTIPIHPLRDFQAEEGALHLLGLSHSMPYPEDQLRAFMRGMRPNTPFHIVYDSAFGVRLQRTAAQLRLLTKHPGLRKAGRIICCGDPRQLDAFSLLVSTRNMRLSPSTDFVFSETCWPLLFSPYDPHGPRPTRFFFAGTSTPARAEIVQRLGPILSPNDVVTLNTRLDNETYVGELLKSQFSLCLPGAGAWSHRIVESALLGAIPIVGRQAFEFVADMIPRESAILVSHDYNPAAWLAAIQKARSLSEIEYVKMRSTLHHTRERHWVGGGLQHCITAPFLPEK